MARAGANGCDCSSSRSDDWRSVHSSAKTSDDESASPNYPGEQHDGKRLLEDHVWPYFGVSLVDARGRNLATLPVNSGAQSLTSKYELIRVLHGAACYDETSSSRSSVGPSKVSEHEEERRQPRLRAPASPDGSADVFDALVSADGQSSCAPALLQPARRRGPGSEPALPSSRHVRLVVRSLDRSGRLPAVLLPPHA
ncbi:hypothetical protein GGR52DRAFT_572077 [Hypoxylon sp. FL1284]|nr:hypothetical protein GGR52DRAFT_572077 [Hypoxylon sp. FL1284]